MRSCIPCSTSTSTIGRCTAGATAYSLLARHFNDWFATERKWLTALVKAWANDPQHG